MILTPNRIGASSVQILNGTYKPSYGEHGRHDAGNVASKWISSSTSKSIRHSLFPYTSICVL